MINSNISPADLDAIKQSSAATSQRLPTALGPRPPQESLSVVVVGTEDVPGHTSIGVFAVTNTWSALPSATGRTVTISNIRYDSNGVLDDGVSIVYRRVGTTPTAQIGSGEYHVVTVAANANELEARRVSGSAPVDVTVHVAPMVLDGTTNVQLINTGNASDIGASVGGNLRGGGPLPTTTAQLPATLGTKASAASLSVALATEHLGARTIAQSQSVTIASDQLGTKAAAASVPVVIATDQIAIPTNIVNPVGTPVNVKVVDDDPAGNTTIQNLAVTNAWAALPSVACRTVVLVNARYDSNGVIDDGVLVRYRRVGTTESATLAVGDFHAITVAANANELEISRVDGVVTAVNVPASFNPFVTKGSGSATLVNTSSPTDIGTAVNAAVRGGGALPTASTFSPAERSALATAIADAATSAEDIATEIAGKTLNFLPPAAVRSLGTDCSGSITSGGVAKIALPASTMRQAALFQNTSAGELRFSEFGDPSETTGFSILPGCFYKALTRNDVRVWGASAGQSWAGIAL